ncbi:TPR repeat-containing protein YrrB [Symmachiella dynata]|uniref:protein O-GlcNAc transferase n=1 Tax=Symmachiella dynata TaxID=2527995 RepID=A0A517ZYL3_9PLAN|nr:tetratricopeptide repeat protein [Symmachiella dynata]QDU47584.1 TPR repeat-containing protein YrrB [Symmachiella dynata]
MLTTSKQGTMPPRFTNPADLQNAERLCRQILRIEPAQRDAWHLLGIVAHNQGRNSEGVDAIRHAIALPAANPTALNNEPAAQQTLDRAVKLYRGALEQDPSSAAVYYELGREQLKAGQCQEAICSLEHALAIRGDWTEAQEALAEASLKTGHAEQPVDLLQTANQHYQLGRTHFSQQRFQLADQSFAAALQIDPNHQAAWHDRGAVFLNQGKMDEARRHFDKTLALNPQHADALCNLGLIHLLDNELEIALDYCRRSVKINPQHANTRNILGNVLRGQGKLGEAVAEFQCAIQLNPAFTEAHNNLALSYQTQGRIEEAVAHYRQAAEVRTDCAATHSNLLLSLFYVPENDREAHFREHEKWAAVHGRCSQIEHYENSRDPDRKLRIGYVSPDFRAHPVGTFIEPILKLHQAADYEITCYSNVTSPDEATARFESLVDRWRVTNWQNDDDLAATIVADGIDILIDLAGHTAGNRLGLFARKPAPVQMTYLGYGGTTGLDTVDYRLTDAVADPAGEPVSHTEQLIRLQHGLLCFQPPTAAPLVAEAPLLRNGWITFGSFNNPAKINAKTVELWADVLKNVPTARFLLKYPTFNDSETADYYRELFARHGIAPSRLDIRGGKLPFDEHLAVYGEIDIMLDSLPYTGSTTTCESLWMGVPVLTLCGGSFVQRISASILTQLNMPELITATATEFVSRATQLAAATEDLSRIRQAIREEMRVSPLCDADGYTRELETVYRRAWQRWCHHNRQSPQ